MCSSDIFEFGLLKTFVCREVVCEEQKIQPNSNSLIEHNRKLSINADLSALKKTSFIHFHILR